MFNVDNEKEIPRDVINNECLCQIIGKKEIIIENYKFIKTITNTNIEIICKNYKILIIGEKLNIEYYNSESMVVGGIICEISFL